MPNGKQSIRLQRTRRRTRARHARGTSYLVPPVTWHGPWAWDLFVLRPGGDLNFASCGLIPTYSVGARSLPLHHKGSTEDRLSEVCLAIGCVVHHRHSDPMQAARTPVNGAAHAC